MGGALYRNCISRHPPHIPVVREVFFVKRTVASVVVVLAVLVVAIPGCKGRENASGNGEPTETIAPAAPQPAPTGTEAMTQTVDIGTGRSESEGGVITTPDPGVDTVTDSATTAAPGTSAAPGATTATTAPPTTPIR
jgi:hypothetical protein